MGNPSRPFLPQTVDRKVIINRIRYPDTSGIGGG